MKANPPPAPSSTSAAADEAPPGRSLPYFPVRPAEYLTSESLARFDLAAHGAHTLLCCHAWLHGSVPAQLEGLVVILRSSAVEVQEVMAKLKSCWRDAGDGRLRNAELEVERARSMVKLAKLRAGGRKGAAERQRKKNQRRKARLKPGSSQAEASLQHKGKGEGRPPSPPLPLTSPIQERDGKRVDLEGDPHAVPNHPAQVHELVVESRESPPNDRHPGLEDKGDEPTLPGFDIQLDSNGEFRVTPDAKTAASLAAMRQRREMVS